MSNESEAVQPKHTYRPDDPEFYLHEDENKELQLSPGAELAVALLRIAFAVGRLAATHIMWAPVNRLMLLQCGEKELMHSGRIPNGGFGGMRGCVHYILNKEGVLGFFRGCYTDMMLSLPAYIARVGVAVGIMRLQQKLSNVTWAAALVGVAAPGLRVLITAPIVGAKNTMMCNYSLDIVARSGDGGRMASVNKRKGGEDEDEENEEEAYLYTSAWEAAAAVKKSWGWRGLFYKGVGADIASVYIQSLTMQFMGMLITPKLEGMIQGNVQRPRRQAAVMILTAVGVRFFCSFVFHPLHVIRTRMTLLSRKTVKQGRRKKLWFWEYAQNIVRLDGITSLWAGLRLRLLLDVGGILLGALMGV